jgi:uncharacterized protein with HEPN domain
MQPDDRDIGYLNDMLRFARVAMELTEDRLGDEKTERMRQLALERALEIIGEAARRVSEPFRDAHPEIPWKYIIGNRNVIAHNYDEIVLEVLWTTATRDVPKLVVALLALLPTEPE